MLYKRSVQAPGAVVMVRPHNFRPNDETAADNAYQKHDGRSLKEHARSAFDEVTAMVAQLREAGVDVHLFEDEGIDTPDSVFPNNWFSTHPGGHIAVYPMFAKSRRSERRQDVLDFLKSRYRVQEIVDYSGLEQDNIFLEGTGAMVLDHIERVVYAAKSNRLDPIALERFCTHFGYEPMAFDAKDRSGNEIYHTNVLMCVGTEFAIFAPGMITDEARRDEVISRLEASGRTIIALTEDQINQFAGNALELNGRNGRILALSQTAYDVLSLDQRGEIAQSAELMLFGVPTIEQAGGSVRCMLAGVHLTKR